MFAVSNCNTFFKQKAEDSSVLGTNEKQLIFKDTTLKISKLLDIEKNHLKLEIENDINNEVKEGFIYYSHWDVTHWLNKDKLKLIFNNLTESKVQQYELPLNYAMLKFGITTPKRQAAFLAQIYHESGGLRFWEELASGQNYENRKDLGNTNKGDGVKYKGRSPIQLTGRLNYREFGKKLGIKLEEYPELAKETKTGFLITALFWSVRGLNLIADTNTTESFKRITRLINGGYNGLEDRLKQWEKVKKVIC